MEHYIEGPGKRTEEINLIKFNDIDREREVILTSFFFRLNLPEPTISMRLLNHIFLPFPLNHELNLFLESKKKLINTFRYIFI